MKKILFITIIIATSIFSAHSQDRPGISIFLHQTGMYYSSDNITSEGLGLGIGAHFLHKSQIAGQVDANILWGNGNAITTRIAAGYEKKGKWAPAIYATCNLLWGQRTEILAENGDRPPLPAWAAGVRVTPLKFRTGRGYVSALEFGYCVGPAKAMSLEFSVLSIGIRF
ncbi:MAG: hypothetical protein RBS55_00160 [Bacteroidales bacterium]|jgi:hypothetical protein|nr:hypothetical protein [Bacteroidales bacterium]